jgi:hypothetical protein
MREIRRGLLAALAAAAVVAAAVAYVAAAGDDDVAADGGQPVVPLGPQGIVPQFVVECGFSHAAPDDPIVHPGRPGASHLHQFFGATTVDAHSTAESLRGTPTTCQQPLDTASYWAPALFEDGTQVAPTMLAAYYRPGPDVDPASVRPFPPGLAIIAGDPLASEPQPPSVVGWHCGNAPELTPEPSACPDDAPLALRVTFPDCWDGERVDSDDHRAHMARSRGGRCPASHAVPVPQLILDIHYPITGDAALVLASGSVLTAHADFLNAWDQRKLETEVRSCINRDLTCGVVSNRATG